MKNKNFFKKNGNSIYSFNKVIINIENIEFSIGEYNTLYFNKMVIKKDNKTFDNADFILKMLNINKEQFEKIIEEDNDLKDDIFIFRNKILIKNISINDFINCTKGKINTDNIKFDLKTIETKYYKLMMFENNNIIDVEAQFRALKIDYKKYIKDTFIKNGLEAPNLLYYGFEYNFENKKDIFDFLMLTKSDLFDKIKLGKVVNGLEGIDC